MRVIAGQHKGRRLVAPRRTTRPTLDRVREALFSMLGDVEGARVLDLFAGSGALGIEALSRGAAHLTSVDSDREAIRALRQNLSQLDVLDRSTVFKADATRFLEGAARHESCWDLVFCDPPYRLAHRLCDDLTRLLPPVLAPEARIVLESSTSTPMRLALPVVEERRYGDTTIVIHELEAV
jgi:16S rRNA (guanine966-N2)-methyltransferase